MKDWDREIIILGIILTIAAVGQLVTAFLFYNQEGNTLLRNLGWAVMTLSAIFGWLPIFTFRRKGGVARGESYIHTTELVDTEIYGIVRHPQYLSGILLSIALTLIAQHWLVTALGAVAAVVYYYNTFSEERRCIEKFGDAYREYQRRVPRLNFVLGVARWIRQR